MKTQNRKKLSLDKLQITRLNNLSFIRGGDGDDDPPNTTTNGGPLCPVEQSKEQNNCQGTGEGTN